MSELTLNDVRGLNCKLFNDSDQRSLLSTFDSCFGNVLLVADSGTCAQVLILNDLHVFCDPKLVVQCTMKLPLAGTRERCKMLAAHVTLTRREIFLHCHYAM